MIKFQIGDEVYLGENYWYVYTVMKINSNREVGVMISVNGSMLSAFWVSSKDLKHIN